MTFQHNAIYVKGAKDVPRGEHWAVIGSDAVFTAGDERSRSNPGHGYPAHTDFHPSYVAFVDENDYRLYYEERLLAREDVVGIHVRGTYKAERKIVLTEV